MAFDYKKEYREFYLPPRTPALVEIPEMRFLAVRGAGDPNDEHGAYKSAVGALYAVAYTIKMSYKGPHQIRGFFEYVVPPLEGFWRQEGMAGMDYAHKERLRWISVIRLPEFVTEEEFRWAAAEAGRKKGEDFTGVEFWTHDEGLCVQCMHLGPYDAEPATVEAMDAFARSRGCEPDFSEGRFHHEIYLSDPRKGDPARQKTVIRHPVRRL